MQPADPKPQAGQQLHKPGSCSDLTIHAPQLDLAVISSRHKDGQRGVEGCPVDAPVVPLQHILHHSIAASKDVGVHLEQRQAGYTSQVTNKTVARLPEAWRQVAGSLSSQAAGADTGTGALTLRVS